MSYPTSRQAGAECDAGAETGHRLAGCYLRTMVVCRSQQAADEFAAADSFVRDGTALAHRLRPWTNMFAR